MSIDPQRVPYWKVKFICFGFVFDLTLLACFFPFLLIFLVGFSGRFSKHE